MLVSFVICVCSSSLSFSLVSFLLEKGDTEQHELVRHSLSRIAYALSQFYTCTRSYLGSSSGDRRLFGLGPSPTSLLYVVRV